MFSKLEAGMWPNPDAVAGKVKRIFEGVEPASPERVPPQSTRETAPAIVPKRPSPPRRPQASPSRPSASAEKSPTARKAPIIPKSSNKDLFAQKPKAPASPVKKEEVKKPVGEKPEGGRYGRGKEDSREERPITPGDSKKRAPDSFPKPAEPQKVSTPVAPSPALSHPSHRAETPADYKEEFEEESKTPEPKPATPEPEVAAYPPQEPESHEDEEVEEPQRKAEESQEEPPPQRQEESHSREQPATEDVKEPDMQASEPPAMEPEVPVKEPEQPTREPESHTKEPEPPTREPELPSKDPIPPAAESHTQDPPEPANPRKAESRGRDDEEDLDDLFPEQEISQEVEFTLSLHAPGSVDQPYTNHSSAPEDVSVKSSNPSLAKIKNPHLTVRPGDTANLEVEVVAGEQEMAKSCVLYVSVNGKVRECIKLNVIYTSLEIPQSEPRSMAETPAMDHTEPAADAPEEPPQEAAGSSLPAEEPAAFSPPAVADSEPPAESEPPADADVQSYELSLPVGAKSSKVTSKQKINYTNDESEALTIVVSSSDPTFMEVKEPNITIPPGATGKIKLGFTEVAEAGEKTLFLVISAEGEVREQIEVKVRYVMAEA